MGAPVYLSSASALVMSILLIAAPATQAQQQAPTYTQEQLEQLLAPIALYPDPLLAEVLAASTYPLEIVEEGRWLHDPANAYLASNPQALQNALAQQQWDPNVKALAFFPQVLQMLDGNIQWTEQLGDAFLGQQSAAMDSVQHLRREALDSGVLFSTAQQTVGRQDDIITIEPVTPQTLYVPYYNPETAYGTWPWPDSPPVSFAPPAGIAANRSYLVFSSGFFIVEPLFYIVHYDWHRHRMDMDERHHHGDHPRYDRTHATVTPVQIAHPVVVQPPWQHDASHRHGEPYRHNGMEEHNGDISTQHLPERDAHDRGQPNPTLPPSARIVRPEAAPTVVIRHNIPATSPIQPMPQVRGPEPHPLNGNAPGNHAGGADDHHNRPHDDDHKGDPHNPVSGQPMQR